MNKTSLRARCGRFLQENRRFMIFIALMSVFRSACADWYTVPTGSMLPTIQIGDRVTVNKLAYDVRLPFTGHTLLRTGEPARGDIMVFVSKAAGNRLIKRVVGLPGDTIAMRNEVLLLNGQALSYRLEADSALLSSWTEQLAGQAHRIQLDKTVGAPLANFGPMTIPADYYLVLGDNRRQSADSRVFGLVPRAELAGKATHVAFSLDYDNYYLPRTERLAQSLYQ